jgi:hypothetical protein
MKKAIVVLLLSCLIIGGLASSVSALLPYFTPIFNKVDYYLGDPGVVQVNIETNDQAFDIKEMGFQLYFTRTDGTIFVTQFFGVNYADDNPLQVPANDDVNVTINFDIPQRDDLISGQFYYVFDVTLREQGTTTYYTESSGQQIAQVGDNNCYLSTSEATPSPTPTTEPTPTPSSTPTPTPTPTPTTTPTPTPTPTSTPTPIDFFSVEVLYGIGIAIAAVVIILILVLLKKRKK